MKKGVQKIYTEVAGTYELVNHVLTLGKDIRWRKIAARTAAETGGDNWLDVCSGTGEMVQGLSRTVDRRVTIIALDFSYPMLRRAKNKKYKSQVFFTLGDVTALPFPDSIFDLVTISFATRNINSPKNMLLGCLKEIHRILKPGGLFINLETSQPPSSFIRRLFHFYIKRFVKPIGYFFSGSKAGYSYLSYTIPRFYSAGDFSSLLYKAGFSRVSCRSLLFGIAAIHKAQKGLESG
jgi:demethylmenaquinone methyltransferase/2-methoxy-6-polyprenyl-1,4-benzoquinol methylase